MSVLGWLADKLGFSVPITYNGDLFDEYSELVGDIYIREMCFWSAVNLISNAVSKCEFQTFVKGGEVKDREYYLWNFEPNKNQNSSEFIHKWLAKLYRENECLIIEQNGQLLIADDFTKKEYALYENAFSQVRVGDMTFNRSFWQSEVLYFKLSETKMREIISGLYSSYAKLIAYTMSAYKKSRGTKGIFKYDTLPTAGTDERKNFDALINYKIKKWMEGDNAALPLGKGQDWKELDKKTYSSETTRDIRAMIDDVSDFTAKGFCIPPAILRGDVQDTSKAIDQLLTFCIDPLVDMLSEEINRKRYGYTGFKEGNYLKIDTKTIKHIDLLGVAEKIDKLIASGCFCINDIRKAVGEEPINEDWANQHFITKNYETVEEALKALKGGEE